MESAERMARVMDAETKARLGYACVVCKMTEKWYLIRLMGYGKDNKCHDLQEHDFQKKPIA